MDQKTFFFKTMEFSQLRICRPPPPQKWSHLIRKWAQCWTNEKSIFRFLLFLFFELWLLVFIIYGLYTWIFKCVAADQQKKSFKSGQIYRKHAQLVLTNEKSILRFCNFYFLCYDRFCTQNESKNLANLSTIKFVLCFFLSQKTKNRKNCKIDFSFVSAYCASVMKI